MNDYRFVATERLDIAYLEWNRRGDRTAILLHGWCRPQAFKSALTNSNDRQSPANGQRSRNSS